MKTTDSVMREYHKIMLEWIESQWKIESAHQAGEPYTRMKFEAEADKVNKKLESLISHSLAEARREWVEEMRGKANLIEVRSEARYLTDSGFWATKKLVAKDDVIDLLTVDNPEEEK